MGHPGEVSQKKRIVGGMAVFVPNQRDKLTELTFRFHRAASEFIQKRPAQVSILNEYI